MIQRAGINEVFICRACSRAFIDRDATTPIAVRMSDCIVQEEEITPHPKYPNDSDLATKKWVDVPGQDVVIPEQEALECCSTHSSLCDSRRIRFRKDAKGTVEIVGAGYLE